MQITKEEARQSINDNTATFLRKEHDCKNIFLLHYEFKDQKFFVVEEDDCLFDNDEFLEFVD